MRIKLFPFWVYPGRSFDFLLHQIWIITNNLRGLLGWQEFLWKKARVHLRSLHIVGPVVAFQLLEKFAVIDLWAVVLFITDSVPVLLQDLSFFITQLSKLWSEFLSCMFLFSRLFTVHAFLLKAKNWLWSRLIFESGIQMMLENGEICLLNNLIKRFWFY